LFFVAILLAVFVIVPGIAAAEDSTYTTVDANTAKEMLENNEVTLIDVRTENEFNAAHIEGATWIPVKLALGSAVPFVEYDDFIKEVENSGITKDKPVLVYCLSGTRSQKASQYLADNGYTVYNMPGGIQEWINAGYSVASTFVEVSDVADCIKNALNAQINCVFVLLEVGNDPEAKDRLDKFNRFVDKMEEIEWIDDGQATYLKAEAELIRKMII
jgi:rhodanese-related sulfurtransferase